ncbi:cytochrome P450 [Streptomyces tauricus]
MPNVDDTLPGAARVRASASEPRSTWGDAPGALPLLGHLPRLLRDPLAFLRTLPERGDLVWVRVGPWKAIVVCDPDLVHQVLLDDKTFDRGGLFYDRAREVVGNGLGTCPHDDHRRQRRLVQPAFHSSRLPGYAKAMTDTIVSVTGAWRDGQELDVHTETITLTGRVVAACLFGSALTPAATDRVLADLAATRAGITRRALMPPPLDRLPTRGNRRYHRARNRLRHTLDQVIADRRATGTDHGDLLSILLATHSPANGDAPTGSALSDAELSDQVVTFFPAGMETGASALAFALYLMASHPRLAEQLHAEVDTVLAGRTTADFEDLPRLELTGRFLTETLRLYPPVWIVTRTAVTSTQLGGHPVPAGTTVVHSPYLLHHRPDLFANPEAFDPERWNRPQTPRLPRGAFLPFGSGARKCVAETFALTEVTLALATIAARWQLHLVPGHRLHPTPTAALTPRGLRLRVTARSQPPAVAAPEPSRDPHASQAAGHDAREGCSAVDTEMRAPARRREEASRPLRLRLHHAQGHPPHPHQPGARPGPVRRAEPAP